MNASELLSRAGALGVSVRADGGELVLRYRGSLPDDLVNQLRQYKSELLMLLSHQEEAGAGADSVACRGCAAIIPAGTTLCIECGSAHSPLIKFAIQLGDLARQRTLRGRALVVLDGRRYPKLRLRDGRTVGPGLLPWCPVLREADTETLQNIVELAEQVQSRDEED